MLEKARGERFIGSALEAKVLLHVADAELAQSLQGLQGVCPNMSKSSLPAETLSTAQHRKMLGSGQGLMHDTVNMVVDLASNLCSFPFRAAS